MIRTEFDRGDGQLNPVNQEYRDVVLNRAQFIEAIKTQRSPLQPERGAEPRTQQDDATGYRSEDTVVVDLDDAIDLIAFGDPAAPNDSGATAVWGRAKRELDGALKLGKVVASGFWHGRGERKEIPALDWI